MQIKNTDLLSLFENSLIGLDQTQLDQTGVVIQVGDNICRVFGLNHAIYGELITFDGGNKGIILSLEQDYVSVFLLDTTIGVAELETARRSHCVFQTAVGSCLLGRVIDATAQPLDGLGCLGEVEYRSIEQAIPGIIERSPIDEPLQTGTLVVDALIPLGKGQRELIIGNRNTGKTSLALQTIINQKGKDVICIYVSIGQRQANLARIIKELQDNQALEYCIIISAEASQSVLNQYLAPYVGSTIGEYFRQQAKDVLIVYDDLSNHAIAYREMSLLLRRAPGREAYPGDVFYLHSRLLERAGKTTNGGSLTALPIVQIQGDDITSYIPTNLISITDGQIFLDTQLFNQGMRPAVNVELSVSRVGGAAQTKAMKKVTQALRLEIAQYHELLEFSQFGTELDMLAQKRLTRGKIVMELLKQPYDCRYSLFEEVVLLFLLKENMLDSLDFKKIALYVAQYKSYVQAVYPDIKIHIEESKDINPATRSKLLEITQEFSKIFVAQD